MLEDIDTEQIYNTATILQHVWLAFSHCHKRAVVINKKSLIDYVNVAME